MGFLLIIILLLRLLSKPTTHKGVIELKENAVISLLPKMSLLNKNNVTICQNEIIRRSSLRREEKWSTAELVSPTPPAALQNANCGLSCIPIECILIDFR